MAWEQLDEIRSDNKHENSNGKRAIARNTTIIPIHIWLVSSFQLRLRTNQNARRPKQNAKTIFYFQKQNISTQKQSIENMIGLTMRLAPVIYLLCLHVTVAAIISCDNLSPKTCSDFCLENILYLKWDGLDCTQSPCDIAALAAEALATGVAEHARLLANRLSTLPDFRLCDGFVCGNIYDCSHSEYDVSDLCHNFEAYHEGQVCVSPDGLLIFAEYMDRDYIQASTDCGVSSFEETIVTFSRNVTIMKQKASFGYCEDDANEASLAADVTSLAAHIGSGTPSQPGQASATDVTSAAAQLVSGPSSQSEQESAGCAPVQGSTIGLVASAFFSLLTPRWV
jgi:hypothetical protein